MAGPANQRLLRAQGINSADPRLARVRRPGYQLCPRVLSFRVASWGRGGGAVCGDGSLREGPSAIFQQNDQGPERLRLKGTPHSPAQDPPGASSPPRINSKPVPRPQGPAASLNAALLSHTCPLSLPDPPPPPATCPCPGTLALALHMSRAPFPDLQKAPPSALFSNVISQRGPRWPPL